jgi:signal transduction histidine kinase
MPNAKFRLARRKMTPLPVERDERERDADSLTQLQNRLNQLSEIGQSLSTEKDISRLLGRIMDVCIRLTASDAGSLYLVVEGDTHRLSAIRNGDMANRVLQFAYARNHNDTFHFETFFTPIRADSINGHAIFSGQPVRIADAYRLPDDAPYRHNRSFDEQTGYRTCSMLTLPMKNHKDDIIGVIQLINRKTDPEMDLDMSATNEWTGQVLTYSYDDECLMRAFAAQAAVALENSLLYREQQDLLEEQKELNERLTGMNRQLIELSRKILTAHEDERKRVARDIHDGPAQTIVNLTLKTEICRKFLERGDSEAAVNQLNLLQSQIKAASSDVRAIIYNLKPSWLEDGLFMAMRSRMDAFAESGTAKPILSLAGNDMTLPHYMTAAIFQIVQEALTNITKYAEATLVEVHITVTDTMLQAYIRDNGKGFDSTEVAARVQNRRAGSGFGMEGMRERVELLRGELNVLSAPGKGTTVSLTVPL